MIDASNITSFSVVLSANGVTHSFDPTMGAGVYGDGFIATSSNILFDFDDSAAIDFDNNSHDFLQFRGDPDGGFATIFLGSVTEQDASESGTQVIASVPEAETWAMMVVGFGAVGGAMRRRHKRAASFT